jgi:hypothetical protein
MRQLACCWRLHLVIGVFEIAVALTTNTVPDTADAGVGRDYGR